MHSANLIPCVWMSWVVGGPLLPLPAVVLLPLLLPAGCSSTHADHGDQGNGGEWPKLLFMFPSSLVSALARGRAERLGHGCIRGSCVGSAYMGGHP